MKKFDIKWILILVLVVILAFGLVACGNKGGGDNSQQEEPDEPVVDPNKSTPSEFFGALWESSKTLGAEEVNPQTDKVHIGMAMDLSLTSNDVTELDVGIEFGIVADLKAMNKDDNLGDTALKLKAFDKVTGKNWITLWYFLKDTERDNIYLQVLEENFKVSFDAYWNSEFSTLLGGLLQENILNNNTVSLLKLINGIAESGGSDWSLDTLILGNKGKGGNFDGLLAAFGLNLSEILENPTVKSILGNKVDTSSLGSILQSMGGVVLESTGCKKYAESDGSTTYVASKLSKTATTLLNGFTDNLFNSISALSLSFNVKKDGSINGLTIALAGKADLNRTEIKINITDVTIKKTDKAATEVLGKAADSAIKSYADIHWVGVMDARAWGIQLNPQLDDNTDNNIKIGKVTVALDASIDLVGAGDANKTAAKLTITNNTLAGDNGVGDIVLTAIYKDHVLTLQTDLTKENNKAIAKEALYPLAKLIKKAAVGTTTEKVAVPYKIFGDMADQVIAKMFTVSDDKVTAVKENFTTIAITGVDIKTLAKGAFYAIFSDFATGAGDEKPGEVVDLATYADDTYVYTNGKTYTDGQYAWSLDIAKTAGVVLKAIKYNATSKDYSIELSSIAATLKSVFKKAAVESTDKVKTDVAAPSTVEEMMALFMCTNDGILLDLTKHGLLPLYDKTTGITDKYIAATTNETNKTVSLADAGAYYAISGKMISKADAILIWKYLTGQNTSLKLSFQDKAGTYYNYDADTTKDTEAKFVANSTIGWFVKFIKGTQLVSGKDVKDVVEYVTGTNSGLKITLNRLDGSMSCDVKLAALSTTGTIDYTVKGTNEACSRVPSQIDYETIAAADEGNNAVVVNLDPYFYTLFNSAFGSGYGTAVANNHGRNESLYYIATAATYQDATAANELGTFTSITYAGKAIIITSATEGYLVEDTGLTAVTYSIANKVFTLKQADGETKIADYDILGTAYKVLKVKA